MGNVGAALATGRGAIVIALLVLGGIALISPQFSRSAALVGGRLIRSGGRELAARGPGVLAAVPARQILPELLPLLSHAELVTRQTLLELLPLLL